jgi:hypothetical protein
VGWCLLVGVCVCVCVCVCVEGCRVIARCRASRNSLVGALVGNGAGVLVWYVQIRRFLIEYHIFVPTPVYARGLIILDEVAARVGGISDKCAFVSYWRGLLLCLCVALAMEVPLCRTGDKVFCCALAKAVVVPLLRSLLCLG